MFMVVLVGCIGAYYQRGAVASAAVISYMAGVPSNSGRSASRLWRKGAVCSFKASQWSYFPYFSIIYPNMATKMYFYVGSQFEWSLRNYFLMREKTFKRLRNELYNKQLQKLMLLDGCRRSLFFFTGINRSSCSFESRSIYIYIYQWCYTQREWHSSNFLPESWHAHESSCLTQKKQTKLCPHSYRCPLESRDREVVISCYIMLFFYMSHFGWSSPMKIRQILIGPAAFWVWPNPHDS